jgi:serine/threonine-protein kinase RsbT
MVDSQEVRLRVAADADIVEARMLGRQLAEQAGFTATDLTLIATAISEIARNITSYAGTGEIVMRVVRGNGQAGFEVVATDRGPGIPDVERALTDGFSTGRGMGLGLPGARRLMDEFLIESTVGVGTTVTMRKWGAYRVG